MGGKCLAADSCARFFLRREEGTVVICGLELQRPDWFPGGWGGEQKVVWVMLYEYINYYDSTSGVRFSLTG